MPNFSFLFIITFIILLTMIAQGCTGIKTYAYMRPFIPGNAIAEDRPGGRPEDRIFIYEVYIETNSSKPPTILQAWINNTNYTASIALVPQTKVAAGIYQGQDDTAFVMKAAARNFLYKVLFQQATVPHALPAAYQKVPATEILLQVQTGGKVKLLLTPPAQMLQPEVVY